MPAPSTQPETEALLEKSVEAMLAQTAHGDPAPDADAPHEDADGPDGAGVETKAEDAPPVEGDMLAPEDLPGGANDPVASALASVAKDLDDLRREADEARPGSVAPDAGAGRDSTSDPDAPESPPVDEEPAIASIEELDRALAEIAEEQLGDEQDTSAQDAEAEKVRAVLEQAAVIEPETVEAAPPRPAVASDAEASGAPPGPEAEAPAGEFAAPELGEPEIAPPEIVAQPEAQPAPAPVVAVPVAPAPPAPKPDAAAREVRPAPAPPKPERASGAEKAGRVRPGALIAAFFSLINEPFRDLSPGARDTLSIIAVITMFNALCLWAFIFLR